MHGSEEMDWAFRGNMDKIFSDVYFSKLCEGRFRNKFGYSYGLILKKGSNGKAGFKVDLGASREIASFFLLNPVFMDISNGY